MLMNSATKYTNSLIMIIKAPTVNKQFLGLWGSELSIRAGSGLWQQLPTSMYNLKPQTLKHRSYGRDIEGLGFRVARQSVCNRVIFIRDLESVLGCGFVWLLSAFT